MAFKRREAIASLQTRSLRALSAALAALVGAVTVSAPDISLAQINDQSIRETLGVSAEQQPTTLEADVIEYDRNRGFVRARGNVQIFYDGRLLKADQIYYNARTNEISAKGSITVISRDGSVLVADEATFDTEIRNGLIRGARAVLADGKSRMAAVEARRVDGDITTLSKAVYSPCEVCRDSPTPLWRIRARRIIHNQKTREITYQDAVFEVAGVPIAWLPTFSHADPTIKRMDGFLTPSLSSDDELGFGVSASYYMTFGPNRDLTATVFAFSEENPVVQLEYRELQTYGEFRISGSATYSRDEERDGFRGHLVGQGKLGLGDNFYFGYDILVATDKTYLRRYDFSDADRGQAEFYVQRYDSNSFFLAEAIGYQTFRTDEESSTLPQILPHVQGERWLDAPALGGSFVLRGDALWLQREEGRDVGRLSAEAGWQGGFTTSGGVIVEATASVRGDLYSVQGDTEIDDGVSGRILPLASVTATYPLGKVTSGASHVIEPIGVLVWAPDTGDDPTVFANEDSQDFELDELSIFSVRRVTGLDRWEEGARATFGLRYTRDALNNGIDIELALGQSYRFKESNVFSASSGLSDQVSDIVGSWRVEKKNLFSISHRFRMSADDGELERNEIYASLQPFDRLRLNGAFVHISADPAIDADEDRTEAYFNAEVDITKHWRLSGEARRDFESGRFVSAGAGVQYHDECLEVDLTVKRRFNSVEDAPSETSFGLNIRLLGIDGG